jgi:lipopolysaccharide heptosyltransferase II
MTQTAWRHARNMLCIRLDYLGDVLMCTPAMRALKESIPQCRLTLLTSSGSAAAARMIAEIDAVIEYAAPWMKSSRPHPPAADFAMIRTLQSHQFDAAVIFTTYSQSPLPAALFCQLAAIPLRLAHCHENPYQLLTQWVRDPEPQEHIRHEVRRQLDLVASIGCHTANERLSFQVPPADAAWARSRLQAIGIGTTDTARPWVLLHPGASAPSRRYPAEQWAQAADEIALRLDCPLVFTGGADEIALVEAIRRNMNAVSHSLAGELDIGKLGAVIAQAPVLVSNNTGPAHLSAAVGTPVVDLYALTNPQHTPWQVPNRVLYHMVPCFNCYQSICPESHHNCLTQVTPARVAGAVVELLQACTVNGNMAAGFSANTEHPLPILLRAAAASAQCETGEKRASVLAEPAATAVSGMHPLQRFPVP